MLSDHKTREVFGKLSKKRVEKRKFSKIIITTCKYLKDDCVPMRLDRLRMTPKGRTGTSVGSENRKDFC